MQQRSSGTRGLVFGGLMAAMVVVFALVPFLSVLMPIPLILAYVRYGGRVAILAGAVAGLFSGMFVGPLQALTFLIPMGILPGLVLGYGFRNKLSLLKIGIVAVAVAFAASAADYMITRYAMFGGRDPFVVSMEKPEVRAQFDRFFTQYEEQLKSMPMSEEQRAQTLSQLKQVQENLPVLLEQIIPTTWFFGGVFLTWLNYSLSRWILPRFGHTIPAATPFAELRLPVWLTWAFVPFWMLGMYLSAQPASVSGWEQVAINVAMPLIFIFALVGMAVAYGFLRKKEVPKVAAVIFIGLGMFMFGGLGMQLYIMLAMWDSVFDFRGLGHGTWKRPEETP